MLHAALRRPVMPSYRIFVIFSIFAILLSGCGPLRLAPPTATPSPLPPTVTFTLPPTETATPTLTRTPVPPTSTPTPDRTATLEAEVRATGDAALAEILPEMEDLGLSPKDGHIEWFNPEKLSLSVDSHLENEYVKLDVGDATDFIVHTDVAWDSTSGLAGCGIVFRADEDLRDGGYYDFALMRLQFQPGWDIEYFKFGKWQQTLTNKVVFTDFINDSPWSTNELTLEVKGNQFTPYINGEKFRAVTHDKQKRGLIAFHVWQESGTTDCDFSNSWLWMPGPAEEGGLRSGLQAN